MSMLNHESSYLSQIYTYLLVLRDVASQSKFEIIWGVCSIYKAEVVAWIMVRIDRDYHLSR